MHCRSRRSRDEGEDQATTLHRSGRKLTLSRDPGLIGASFKLVSTVLK